jgi:ketosteroid isomerase-like protein
MRQPPTFAAILGGSPDEVDAAFYEALQSGDINKLMACWADEEEIACIHPGGARAIGLGDIRASFEAIFADGAAIDARPQCVARWHSSHTAVHHLIESVNVMTSTGPGTALVTTTHVFHRAAQGWRLVVHHASPGTPQDARVPERAPQILH